MRGVAREEQPAVDSGDPQLDVARVFDANQEISPIDARPFAWNCLGIASDAYKMLFFHRDDTPAAGCH